MTSIHAQSSAYTMEYSNHVTGALDLSRSRRPEPYYREDLSLHNYDREMESHSPSNHPNCPKVRRLSPSLKESDSTKHYKIEDRLHNTSEQSVDEAYLNNFYRREARSPSLYGNDNKETSHSPSQISGQVSPNYASCFPGTEHMNPYIIQAALRQQMILQNKKSSTKGDSDDISDTGSDGSQNSNIPIYPIATPGRDGKMPRPFKAYPKDPMSLAAGFSTVDSLLDTQSAEKYSAFRKRMLDQICAANGGQATVSNPKMRRTVNTNSNAVCYTSDDGSLKYDHPSKDTSYTERRKKNNAAAKKSRDRRRIKEDEIAIRAAFLERENIELKFELAAAKKQLALCGITMGNNPGH